MLSRLRGFFLAACMLCGLFTITALTGRATAAQPEMRGFWAHGKAVASRKAADKCVARLDAAHLNAVFLLVWYWGGRTFCHSDLCPMASDIEPGFDPMAYMIDQCHRRGIEVHAWFVNGEIDSRRGHCVLDRHPDWAVESGTKPGPTAWYDFGKPEVRKFQSDLMIETLRRYDLDGLHFDYIRYDKGPVVCHCKHCQDEFAARSGLEPRYAPLAADAKVDAKSENLRLKQWAEYRKATVTALVRDVYVRAKSIKPKSQVTAAVFTPLEKAEVRCQDWPGWLREGIIDYVIPMAYTDKNDELARQIAEWKTMDPSLERIVPGLSVYQWQPSGIISRLPRQVVGQHQLCLDYGAHGNVYFSYANFDQAISDALRGRYYSAPAAAYRPPERGKGK